MTRRLWMSNPAYYLLTPVDEVDEARWQDDVAETAFIEHVQRLNALTAKGGHADSDLSLPQWARQVEQEILASFWTLIQQDQTTRRYAPLVNHLRRLSRGVSPS